MFHFHHRSTPCIPPDIDHDLIQTLSKSICDPNDPTQYIDIIVSNPPYIPQGHWAKLPSGVTLWEDKRALLAGETGTLFHRILLRHYERMVQGSPTSNYAAVGIPRLVMELDGRHQIQELQAMHAEMGIPGAISFQKDLFGDHRTMMIEL